MPFAIYMQYRGRHPPAQEPTRERLFLTNGDGCTLTGQTNPVDLGGGKVKLRPFRDISSQTRRKPC